MAFIMSSRLAAELDHAFERNGWSAEQVKQLTSGTFLADVRRVVLGQAEIKITKHVIDCDADPFVPDGWKVEEHQKGGKLTFDASRIELYLSDSQKNRTDIKGEEHRKELAGKPVLNANVLHYLLAHPELIPEDWKGKDVFFWGTIHRLPDGHVHVSFLTWLNDKWCGSWYRIDGELWGGPLFRPDHAAMLMGEKQEKKEGFNFSFF